VTVVVADEYPNYSIRGLPLFLSGEVEDWRTLAHRGVEEIEGASIHLLLNHKAEVIDPGAKAFRVRGREGREIELGYDKLIIATGAASVRPPMEGLDLPGVFFLRWMEEGFRIREYLERYRPETAIILGSGYIGMEMADALTRKGLKVTVLLRSGRVLKTVDSNQMVGSHKAEVSKRVDIFATAIFNEMTIGSLNDLDLSCTPPLSSPWDPVQQAAQEWKRKKETCK
jgi:NADPH-dependent 2,4-dienoyl-CoA reductase/sulfur reductase-like enzyme